MECFGSLLLMRLLLSALALGVLDSIGERLVPFYMSNCDRQ